MRAKTRLNIALVAGLVVIGALLWLGLHEDVADPMLELDPENLQELSVDAGGVERLRLERREGDWYLSHPLAIRADEERLRQLLPLLRAPVRNRYSVDEVDPARFGLDDPALRLRANGQEILFGDMEGVDRQRYARVGDEILLVDEMVFFQFNRPPEILADHHPLPPETDIDSIEFPGRTLARDEAGRWQLEPAEGLEQADAETVAAGWRDARADSVAAWPRPMEQALLIRVHLEDGSTRVFHLLDSDERVLLGDAEHGLLYQFPRAAVGQLLPGMEAD